MERKSRQNLQEINWNVLVRASQTFAWMQELRAKGHLTGYLVKDMMFVFTKMLLSFSNNSSAAVESVDATVVEKKQGIYTHMQSEAHVPWFRVVFEMTDGSLMEFQMQQGDFRELEKGDRGMLTYQGNRYICYQKYKFKSEAQEEKKC